jgi:hypothetical protein
MKHIKPDSSQLISIYTDKTAAKIFLAGSIENGTARKWQEEIVKHFRIYDVIFFNPYRDNWDAEIKNSQSNPNFNNQVNWEMDKIEKSDIIVFNIEPDTKSPITLMELGFCIGRLGSIHVSKRLIVRCPSEFWRAGNVELICTRYDVQLVRSFEELKGSLMTILKDYKPD